MTPIETLNGEVIDLDTGNIVARTPGAAPPTASTRSPRFQAAIPEGDRVNGILRNATWGFQSALFALPDAATLAIGRGLGLNEEEVFTLGKFFNKNVSKALTGVEETAPRSSEERYARAFFEGMGGAMPLTGTLAFAARMRPMVTTAQTAKTGVLKGIADDAIKFVQRNPRAALAIDIAFGAGYEGLRQAVTENVSDDNPNKKLYEELLPMGAFIGLPMAVQFLPSVMAGKAVNKKIQSAISGQGDTDEILSTLPRPWRLPIIRIAPKMLKKNAESKLSEVFGPIEKSPDAQAAIKQLELAMQDPRFPEAGFVFNVAEERMTPELLARTAELIKKLGPTELAEFKKRVNENQLKFAGLFDSLAPEARQPMIEAFKAAQAERQSLFDNLLLAQKDLTEAERMAISERLGPQNMDMINDELRGSLMGAMEFDHKMRENVLRRMGLRQAIGPDNVQLSTRSEGKSLYPSRNMEEAAKALVKKYLIERPSQSTPIPEPIAFLRNFIQSQDVARARMERIKTQEFLDNALAPQFKALDLAPDIQESVRKGAMLAMKGSSLKIPKTARAQYDAPGQKLSVNNKGEAFIYSGIPGKPIKINPKQIQEDAALAVEDTTSIDINLPEALDYLEAAARYRNDALIRYNRAMAKGSSRITDAQRILDTGKAVYNDIEKLILDHVPKIKSEYEGMKNILSDYRAGFEQSLPLLMSQKRMRGDEYLLPNEDLMRVAFSNARNLQQLQVSLGGTPGFDDLLMKGTVDWLRSKGVVNQDGLVDPKKIRSVLDKNRNIVESLPDTIQAKLTDEVALADDYVKRMGELEDRRVLIKNDELDNILRKVARPDADPRQVLAKAIEDPAVMRMLVDELGKDPDRLAALRRSVFNVAGEGAKKGGALKTFLENNEKSLKVLYKDTEHFDNLVKLADVQRRVEAFSDVTGQVPDFNSLDQTLRKVFGSGIQFLTTTLRETAVGRISPATGLLALTVRLVSSVESEIFDKIFLKALADPAFAKSLNSLNSPAQAQKVVAGLESIGIPRTALIPPRALAEETSRAVTEDREVPGRREAPVVSRETAASMLRALPPAPPTSGTLLPKNPMPPPPVNPPQIPLMYPALFPNDPISGLLEQRSRQIQSGQMQPVPPGQLYQPQR